jgi:hypothetical protein
MREQYLPSARKFKLVVRELAEEVLVYDEETHRAHCLNRTAALVWKHCDGKTPVSGIAERVGGQLSSGVSEDLVWLALDQLTEFDLLASGTARPSASNQISRRKMIRRLGLAAAISLPLITSIVSPTPAQAQSCGTPCTVDTECPPGQGCVAGCCEPNEA